jgi:hypothetical protein
LTTRVTFLSRKRLGVYCHIKRKKERKKKRAAKRVSNEDMCVYAAVTKRGSRMVPDAKCGMNVDSSAR